MKPDDIIYRSLESANSFIDDYLNFGIYNRTVAVESLLAGFDACSTRDKRLRGAKIYAEYGGAIEELFVYIYATYKQNKSKSQVFLKTLITYKSKWLNDFISQTDFRKDMEDTLGFPSAEQYGDLAGIDSRIAKELYSELAQNLEALKTERESKKYREIYNKLKHPFLVKGILPINVASSENFVGVLKKPENQLDIATGITLNVHEDELKRLCGHLLVIRGMIELVLKIARASFKLRYEQSE